MFRNFDLSQVNFEALDTVIRRLESLPGENFDLANWYEGGAAPAVALTQPNCGTTMCIIGALAAAQELDFTLDATLLPIHPRSVLMSQAFAEETGIPQRLASTLIDPFQGECYYGSTDPSKTDVLNVFYTLREEARLNVN